MMSRVYSFGLSRVSQQRKHPVGTCLSPFSRARAGLVTSTLYRRYFAFPILTWTGPPAQYLTTQLPYCFNCTSCSHVGRSISSQYVYYCTAILPPSPLVSRCFVSTRVLRGRCLVQLPHRPWSGETGVKVPSLCSVRSCS